ncbi:hypothetical protein KIPB_012654, partial [Kipferlia bialata]|eukprot:g12654.t1
MAGQAKRASKRFEKAVKAAVGTRTPRKRASRKVDPKLVLYLSELRESVELFLSSASVNDQALDLADCLTFVPSLLGDRALP